MVGDTNSSVAEDGVPPKYKPSVLLAPALELPFLAVFKLLTSVHEDPFHASVFAVFYGV